MTPSHFPEPSSGFFWPPSLIFDIPDLRHVNIAEVTLKFKLGIGNGGNRRRSSLNTQHIKP